MDSRMMARMTSLSIFMVILPFISNCGFCLGSMPLNVSVDAFSSAVATWYGPANGPGSGGGCGFANDVAFAPFSGRITAGNQAIYQRGKGCGACYSVLCTANPSCSGQAITVTVTDECPGACNNDPVHFDLSGFAFGLLAKPGQQDALRKAGRIPISYQRVPCNYGNQKITFKVLGGSNQFFFSTAVEYVNGDGDIGALEIKPVGFSQFVPMQQGFGATFKYNIPSGVKAPFSIRVTLGESRRSVVAQDVIPAAWQPGSSYTSSVNF